MSALIEARIATADQVASLRGDYKTRKTAILERLRSGAPVRNVHAVLRELSALADRTLRALWNDAGFDSNFALVAVGGFGRGELFPFSDIDVLLLLPEDAHASGEAQISLLESFISQCWDAGLEISSSVRSVEQCLAEGAKDLTVQTSLLESRLVEGDEALYAGFRTRFKAAIDPRAFVAAKAQEMRHRHRKYDDTPYALEPNCKEAPGGLRDLQVLLWMTRAAGLGERWDDLAANGLATAFEVLQIKRNESLLSLVRARLHVIANRREDRLVFDLQTAVAESFGYQSAGQRRAGEALMRRYYWAAKAVTQLNQILLLNIAERLQPPAAEPRRLNARFFEKNGTIEVASDDLYVVHPEAILETFLLYQTTPGVKGLVGADLARALQRAPCDGQRLSP